LIVIKTELISSGGMQFTKEVPVAAYKSKTARNIATGLTLSIGSDFEEEPDVPDIGGEGD